jgi:hypothetical protein
MVGPRSALIMSASAQITDLPDFSTTPGNPWRSFRKRPMKAQEETGAEVARS